MATHASTPAHRVRLDRDGRAARGLTDGPQVWTIAEAWLAHAANERDSHTVSDAVGVPVPQVEAALAYWADHRAEIEDVIRRHHAAQDEALAAWERRLALKSA